MLLQTRVLILASPIYEVAESIRDARGHACSEGREASEAAEAARIVGDPTGAGRAKNFSTTFKEKSTCLTESCNKVPARWKVGGQEGLNMIDKWDTFVGNRDSKGSHWYSRADTERFYEFRNRCGGGVKTFEIQRARNMCENLHKRAMKFGKSHERTEWPLCAAISGCTITRARRCRVCAFRSSTTIYLIIEAFQR